MQNCDRRPSFPQAAYDRNGKVERQRLDGRDRQDRRVGLLVNPSRRKLEADDQGLIRAGLPYACRTVAVGEDRNPSEARSRGWGTAADVPVRHN